MSKTELSLPIIDRWGSEFVYSHSKLSSFDNCPKAFWHSYINGDVTINYTSAATEFGKVHHKHLENAVLTNASELHPEAAQFPSLVNYFNGIQRVRKKMTETFKSEPMLCPELTAAVDTDMEPCEYYGPRDQRYRRLLIGKVDLAMVCHPGKGDLAVVFDLKTGNPAWSSPEQLKRMALLLFKLYPHIKVIRSAYVWTKDNGKPEWITKLGRDADLPMLEKSLRYDVSIIEKCHLAGKWPAKPSGLCKTCPVKSYQCEHKR